MKRGNKILEQERKAVKSVFRRLSKKSVLTILSVFARSTEQLLTEVQPNP